MRSLTKCEFLFRNTTQVALPVPEEGLFLDKLLQWSVNQADNKLQNEASEHAISSVLNKRVEGQRKYVIEDRSH